MAMVCFCNKQLQRVRALAEGRCTGLHARMRSRGSTGDYRLACLPCSHKHGHASFRMHTGARNQEYSTILHRHRPYVHQLLLHGGPRRHQHPVQTTASGVCSKWSVFNKTLLSHLHLHCCCEPLMLVGSASVSAWKVGLAHHRPHLHGQQPLQPVCVLCA